MQVKLLLVITITLVSGGVLKKRAEDTSIEINEPFKFGYGIPLFRKRGGRMLGDDSDEFGYGYGMPLFRKRHWNKRSFPQDDLEASLQNQARQNWYWCCK